EGNGDLEIGVENGVFEIAVNELSVHLFILDVTISGYIRSDGNFNLTGGVELDLTGGGFGIQGELSVTVGTSGFSGHGAVGIVIFGERFNIASADVSVTISPSSVYI